MFQSVGFRFQPRQRFQNLFDSKLGSRRDVGSGRFQSVGDLVVVLGVQRSVGEFASENDVAICRQNVAKKSMLSPADVRVTIDLGTDKICLIHL
jgi:hypothetical protein